MDNDQVRRWLIIRIKTVISVSDTNDYSITECIERLRATIDEAELRLTNPNFPSNE